MPKLSVIIPIYNKWELTANCLTSLAHTKQDIEVIVVNNASKDISKEDILAFGKSLFADKFKLANMQENIGFAKASNIGAKLAKADYLFFLNNDTLVYENALELLIKELEANPQKRVFAPLLIYESPKSNAYNAGRVQHGGVVFYPNLHLSHFCTFFPYTHKVFQTKHKFTALTAAALIINKQFFFECEMFYEGYINGFEDVDLCQQIVQKGGSFEIIPNAIFIHLESQSEGRSACEEHNAALLSQRCTAKFKPDLHNFMLASNYEAFLDETYSIYFTLNSDISKDLLELCKVKNDIYFFIEKLLAEPLWKEGYEYFWQNCANKVGANIKLSMAVLEYTFFYGEQSAKRIITVHNEMGIDARDYRNRLDSLYTKIANKEEIHNNVLNILSIAQTNNDEYLLKLYLKKYQQDFSN